MLISWWERKRWERRRGGRRCASSCCLGHTFSRLVAGQVRGVPPSDTGRSPTQLCSAGRGDAHVGSTSFPSPPGASSRSAKAICGRRGSPRSHLPIQASAFWELVLNPFSPRLADRQTDRQTARQPAMHALVLGLHKGRLMLLSNNDDGLDILSAHHLLDPALSTFRASPCSIPTAPLWKRHYYLLCLTFFN